MCVYQNYCDIASSIDERYCRIVGYKNSYKMDLRNKVTSIFKNISEFLFSTEDRGRCVYCHNVVGDPDEVFCSQRCSLRYWTEYREKQGN